MINLRDLASYDFGKVPFEKNIICWYTVRSGKYEIGNTVCRGGMCDKRWMPRENRSGAS